MDLQLQSISEESAENEYSIEIDLSLIKAAANVHKNCDQDRRIAFENQRPTKFKNEVNISIGAFQPDAECNRVENDGKFSNVEFHLQETITNPTGFNSDAFISSPSSATAELEHSRSVNSQWSHLRRKNPNKSVYSTTSNSWNTSRKRPHSEQEEEEEEEEAGEDDDDDQEENGDEANNQMLNSIHFSMHTLQGSQISEIDVLLSELDQLQAAFDNAHANEATSNYLSHSVPNSLNGQPLALTSASDVTYNNHSMNSSRRGHSRGDFQAPDDIETIDQQFDQVLRFLAQSIDENKCSDDQQSSSSPSSLEMLTPSGGEMDSDSNANDFERFSNSNIHQYNHSKSHQQQTYLYAYRPQHRHQVMSSHNTANIITHDQHIMEKSCDFTLSRSAAAAAAAAVDNAVSSVNDGTSNRKQATRLPIRSAFVVRGAESEREGNKRVVDGQDCSNNSNTSDIKTCDQREMVKHSAVNHSKNTTKAPTAAPTTTDKAELIRIALDKLKEANIKKLIVKVYTDDCCTKSIIIEESMQVLDVMLLLFTKNHISPSLDYSIVEYVPALQMERIFEDHENLVETMSNWTRDSDNRIVLTQKHNKYDLFTRPELYLMNESHPKKLDEHERNNLINDFFSNIGAPIPQIEGPLYLKQDSKKRWKKCHCMLRQSGLYYVPRGKKNKKDLECLLSFNKLDLYYGVNWQKLFKSPTEFCFALKYPHVQNKSSKYIKYICCENSSDLKRWTNGIRIAKFGKQLHDNYRKVLDLIEINRLTGRLPLVSVRRLSSLVVSNSIGQNTANAATAAATTAAAAAAAYCTQRSSSSNYSLDNLDITNSEASGGDNSSKSGTDNSQCGRADDVPNDANISHFTLPITDSRSCNKEQTLSNGLLAAASSSHAALPLSMMSNVTSLDETTAAVAAEQCVEPRALSQTCRQRQNKLRQQLSQLALLPSPPPPPPTESIQLSKSYAGDGKQFERNDEAFENSLSAKLTKQATLEAAAAAAATSADSYLFSSEYTLRVNRMKTPPPAQYDYSNENIYDLPSPPIELLQMRDDITVNMNGARSAKGNGDARGGMQTSRCFITGISSPQTTRRNHQSLEQLVGFKPIAAKAATGVVDSTVMCSRSNDKKQLQNVQSQMLSELSTILARVKPSDEQTLSNNHNLQLSLIKKPPPPPRSERTQLTQRFS